MSNSVGFKGFSQVEILVVIAISGLLASVTIPNYLEKQIQAKVAQCKTEMRTLAVAIACYQVDNNNYPTGAPQYPEGYVKYRLWRLTTPIEYLSQLPDDPFRNEDTTVGGQPGDMPSFTYLLNTYHFFSLYWDTIPGFRQVVPNRDVQWIVVSKGPLSENTNWIDWIPYDPTNGIVSKGELISFGPGGPFAEDYNEGH